jgi:hypothetical protein
LEELAKSPKLELVQDPDSADFFIDSTVYMSGGSPDVTLSRDPDLNSRHYHEDPSTNVGLDVFTRGRRYADGCYSRRIVWRGWQTRSGPTGSALDPAPVAQKVTRAFIKDLKKVRGKKQLPTSPTTNQKPTSPI